MTWQEEMVREILLENKHVLIEIMKELVPDMLPKEKKLLRHSDIMEVYQVGATKATNMINDIHKEQLTLDSKIPKDSVQYLSSTIRCIRSDVLEWYLANREVLQDNNARKRLEKFEN